ncbi:restriction endonuclease subunit S [Caldifermentibacillus hisashii]|uniref:restriction endonuclease subunit S n=1 Tax=Caldifermentibacillus hisashii TaxID=996558 RepID=UPI0030E9EAF7
MVKIQKVSEVCEIIMGQSPPSDSYNDKGIGMPFFQGKSEFGELNPTPKWYCSSPIRLAEVDDILISVRAPVGDVNIANVNCCIGRGLAAIRPDKTKLLTKFLFYVLKGKKREIENMGTGSTFKAISKKDLVNIKIPVPNIEIQKKIVNTFDKAQELIDKRKAQIEALDQLTQSVFLEMFGDPRSNPKNFNKVSLGELFEIKTGGTPSRNNKDYWNGDIPWVKTTEVNENVIIQTEEFISEEGLSNSNAVLLPANTLLIAMYGQGKTRGRTAKLGIEATTNQACAALLPNTEIEQDFIWKQLIIQYEELRSLGRGGNQPNLNLNLVRQFEVIVPPDSMQREFVGIIKKIDNTKNILKQSMEDLENMFNSLMQRAFKGELFTEQKVSNL